MMYLPLPIFLPEFPLKSDFPFYGGKCPRTPSLKNQTNATSEPYAQNSKLV